MERPNHRIIASTHASTLANDHSMRTNIMHANSCSATVLLLFCCCLLLLLCCCPKKQNPNTNTLSHLQLRVRVLYSFNDSVRTPSWQLAVGGWRATPSYFNASWAKNNNYESWTSCTVMALCSWAGEAVPADLVHGYRCIKARLQEVQRSSCGTIGIICKNDRPPKPPRV